jgi:uncharacterized protein YjeT (DUF2065 family)
MFGDPIAECRVTHALNAIGLCAKVAIIFGVNPMFFVNAWRVDLESAGTCPDSELRFWPSHNLPG